MLEKQNQEAAEGAIAIQATGDVVLVRNGLSVVEVRELVEVFLACHLPAMREHAAATAREQAEAFLERFVAELAKSETAKPEAFASPDSQACFSTAVMGAALKGDQVDLDLLARLVVQRLEEDEDDLMKLVCEQAVALLPKLSRRHLAFIACLFARNNIGWKNPIPAVVVDGLYEKILPLMQEGWDLSHSNRDYLHSLGLYTLLPMKMPAFFTKVREHLSDARESDEELRVQAPNISAFAIADEKSLHGNYLLTAVGRLIAVQYIAPHLNGLNPKTWIS